MFVEIDGNLINLNKVSFVGKADDYRFKFICDGIELQWKSEFHDVLTKAIKDSYPQ